MQMKVRSRIVRSQYGVPRYKYKLFYHSTPRCKKRDQLLNILRVRQAAAREDRIAFKLSGRLATSASTAGSRVRMRAYTPHPIPPIWKESNREYGHLSLFSPRNHGQAPATLCSLDFFFDFLVSFIPFSPLFSTSSSFFFQRSVFSSRRPQVAGTITRCSQRLHCGREHVYCSHCAINNHY